MRQLTHEEVPRQPPRLPVTIVCPDWTDPRNVGSVFRLADAVGARQIILVGTTPTPPNARIAKTARSTVRHVPWLHLPDPTAFLEERQAAGNLIAALELTDKSQSLLTATVPADRPVILLAGNEQRGVPQPLLDRCATAWHLPMHGQNTSMNVSVALGAALYLLLDRLT